MPRLALASLLAIALSSPAAAGVLNTAPGISGTGAAIHCIAQNLDTNAHVVTGRLILEDGTADLTSLAEDIPAGNLVVLVNTGGASPYGYCQFDGLSRKVRGWLAVVEATGPIVMLPATK